MSPPLPRGPGHSLNMLWPGRDGTWPGFAPGHVWRALLDIAVVRSLSVLNLHPILTQPQDRLLWEVGGAVGPPPF